MLWWHFKVYRWGFTWGRLMLSWGCPPGYYNKFHWKWGLEICWGGISDDHVVFSTFNNPPANWTHVDIPGEKGKGGSG